MWFFNLDEGVSVGCCCRCSVRFEAAAVVVRHESGVIRALRRFRRSKRSRTNGEERACHFEKSDVTRLHRPRAFVVAHRSSIADHPGIASFREPRPATGVASAAQPALVQVHL